MEKNKNHIKSSINEGELSFTESQSSKRTLWAFLIAVILHVAIGMSTTMMNEAAEPIIEEEDNSVEIEMIELPPEPEIPEEVEPEPEPPPPEPEPEEPPPPEEAPPEPEPPEELPIEEDTPPEEVAPADAIVEEVTKVVNTRPPPPKVKAKPRPAPFVMPKKAPSRFWTSVGVTNQSGRLKDSEEKPYGCIKFPNVAKGGGVRNRSLEPIVRMKVAIDAQGNVQDFKVIKHEDDWNDEFIVQVRRIIKSCRFEPKEVDGKKVPTWIVREEQFEITPFR